MAWHDFNLSGILVGGFILAIALTPSPATGQMVCSERDKFLKRLGEKYLEAPVAMGLAANGMILEVLASAKGTWTIIVTKPDGLSCAVASGKAWEKIEQHLALGPTT